MQGWLDLQKASDYLSLSIRTLRSYIGHPEHPLPLRRIGKNGKWIGKATDFDRWAESFPMAGQDTDRIVDDVIRAINATGTRGRHE